MQWRTDNEEFIVKRKLNVFRQFLKTHNHKDQAKGYIFGIYLLRY